MPPASPCCAASLALLATPKLPHFRVRDPESPTLTATIVVAVSPELWVLTHAGLCPSARFSTLKRAAPIEHRSVPKLERSDLLSAVC
jgi:hypothetical protein